MNKDIKKLNDLGDEFLYGKIKTNEINKKFIEFYELYKKVLIEQFKNFKNFKLIKIEKEFLYISGYFSFQNKTYFFTTLNLHKFKFSENNIKIKQVEPEIDYINVELSKSINYSFNSFNKEFSILNLN